MERRENRPRRADHSGHGPGLGEDFPAPDTDTTTPPTPDSVPADMLPAADTIAEVTPDPPARPKRSRRSRESTPRGSLAGGAWLGLILGALLLILLLVFILQNQQQVEINLFLWSWEFPAGIAYLFSAISGALITALVGGWRMFELRRQAKQAARNA